MGWFWGNWGGSSSDKDPTKSLDPEWKSFLDSSQPSSYVPAEAPPLPEPVKEKPVLPPQASPGTSSDNNEPSIPKQSLFQDGRYADLWKTYQPPTEGDLTVGERAKPIFQQYKRREHSINDAAMENCALEAQKASVCFEFGDWRDRIWGRATMCHKEKQEMARCYTLQTRFLQALGYRRDPTLPESTHERVQMHADALYHRMLDFEKSVAEARAAGVPEPPLTSLFDPSKPLDPNDIRVTKQLQAQVKTKLEDLPAWEREVHVKAIKDELQTQKVVKDKVQVIVSDEEVKKDKRRQKVSQTFGDSIARFVAPKDAKKDGVETE